MKFSCTLVTRPTASSDFTIPMRRESKKWCLKSHFGGLAVYGHCRVVLKPSIRASVLFGFLVNGIAWSLDGQYGALVGPHRGRDYPNTLGGCASIR